MEHKTIESIDQYLQGKLSSAAKTAFEQRLAKEEALQQKVEEQKEVIAGITAFEKKRDFFNMLGEIKKEQGTTKLSVVKEEVSTEKTAKVVPVTPTKETSRFLGRRTFLGIAASVALLLTAALFLLRPSQQIDTLAQQHFELYPDKMSARFEASGAVSDSDGNLQDLLKAGMDAYQKGDLPTAKQNLQSYKEKSTSNNYFSILTDFYLAQIALSNKKYTQSIQLLNPLTKEQGLPIASAVNWYLALAYLGQSEKAQALSYLEKIPQNSAFYEQAQTLLKELK